MRVRIFKKIMQKNQQVEDEYTERATEFIQELEGQYNPFPTVDIQAAQTSNIYQSMPKRAAKVAMHRSKVHSTLETRNGFFPRISAEPERSRLEGASLE